MSVCMVEHTGEGQHPHHPRTPPPRRHHHYYPLCATRFDAKGKGLGMSGRRDVRDLPTLWPRYLYQHIHIFMNLCLNTNIIDTKIQN